MFISQQLRKENIAEYLLYMWQVEDLIRAYGCSLSRLQAEYISRFDYTPEQKEELTDWYHYLIRMINQEGKRQSGHLQINEIVLQQMEELHQELLQSTKFPFYTSAYYKTLPFIVEIRNKGAQQYGEIETCMNALYGTMLLRLQKKEISPDTQHAISQITTFIGLLSDYFQQDKKGELHLDDEF